MCIYIYIYIHIHIHVCIYIHIHTHYNIMLLDAFSSRLADGQAALDAGGARGMIK